MKIKVKTNKEVFPLNLFNLLFNFALSANHYQSPVSNKHKYFPSQQLKFIQKGYQFTRNVSSTSLLYQRDQI